MVDPCGEEHSAGVSSESIQRLFNANTKSNLSWCKAGDCGLGGWHKVAHVSRWWPTGSTDQEKGACGSAAFPCHLVPPHPVEVLAEAMATSDLKSSLVAMRHLEGRSIAYVHWMPKTQCVDLGTLQAAMCWHRRWG